MSEHEDSEGRRQPTIVITGASAGIGAEGARRMSELGADVVVVGRDPERTERVARESAGRAMTADFSDLADVRRLAERLLEEVPRIDVLVHNAGGVVPEYRTTVDGHEQTLQTNYLAPFLLQRLLHDRLAASRAHVVVTSSIGHRFGTLRLDDLEWRRRRYAAFRVYGTTKLTDLLFARELARRAPRTGIRASAFHPGVVATSFARDSGGALGLFYRTSFGRRFMVSAAEGAAPMILLASAPDPDAVNGQYLEGLRRTRPSRTGRDTELGRRLWAATERLLDLEPTRG